MAQTAAWRSLMPASTTDNNEDQEIMARLADIRRRRMSTFSPRTLAWLALPPGWTEPLAVRCEFPHQYSGLRDFLTQARKAGLCEVSADTSEMLSFWMPAN